MNACRDPIVNLHISSSLYSWSGLRRPGYARSGPQTLHGLLGMWCSFFGIIRVYKTWSCYNFCMILLADEKCRLLFKLCDGGLHYIHQQKEEEQLSREPYWDAGYGGDVQSASGSLSVRHRSAQGRICIMVSIKFYYAHLTIL